TLFHTGGEASHHSVIFAAYAGSGIWTAVHVAQFACMATFLAGLFALFFALDAQMEAARWAGRFGAASTLVTLALCGGVLAVDGVALKQAVNAWANAPDAEKAARFAAAEAIRWLEWGMRSYENFALGLAVLLFAIRGLSDGPGPAVSRVPDVALGRHIPGAGLGRRHRRVFTDEHHRNRPRRSRERGVDDVAPGCRLAHASTALHGADRYAKVRGDFGHRQA